MIAAAEEISFKGKFINYDENKRPGDFGELWVLQYEKENLITAGKQILQTKYSMHYKRKMTEPDLTSFHLNKRVK